MSLCILFTFSFVFYQMPRSDKLMANQSEVFEFILIGFPGLPQRFYHFASLTMFLVYTIALTANGTVILLITFREHLHHPMYLIIMNLSLSDLIFDTITLPKAIAMYWIADGKISLGACMFQLFGVHFLGSFDSFIIMLMAIDRYVAICKPLRYSSIITNKMTVFLCCLLWLIAGMFGLATVLLTARLSFCNSKINHCFCNNAVVILLSCVDSHSTHSVAFILAMIVLLIPLSFIIFSYAIIIRTISTSRGSENWQKAFYTCSTHLFVIGMYYVPRLFVYACNQLRLILNADLNIFLLCLYTFVPHLASPIIYCLRTKEIKKTLKNIFNRNQQIKASL
ncbi:olfactory receptor-like protein I9 [Pelobates fuscus]|uniref:olfactory receptor-like protein I9 n=1 Tax=Pelobates fuscus TaxID=191477 RepID=UPI002FE4B32B